MILTQHAENFDWWWKSIYCLTSLSVTNFGYCNLTEDSLTTRQKNGKRKKNEILRSTIHACMKNLHEKLGWKTCMKNFHLVLNVRGTLILQNEEECSFIMLLVFEYQVWEIKEDTNFKNNHNSTKALLTSDLFLSVIFEVNMIAAMCSTNKESKIEDDTRDPKK